MTQWVKWQRTGGTNTKPYFTTVEAPAGDEWKKVRVKHLKGYSYISKSDKKLVNRKMWD